MEWARYLGSAFGTEGAASALRFYEDVNWISEDVRRTMVDYVRGLSLDELTEERDVEVELDETIATLEGTPFERHAKSIQYIASIAGDSIEYDLIPLRLPENDGRVSPRSENDSTEREPHTPDVEQTAEPVIDAGAHTVDELEELLASDDHDWTVETLREVYAAEVDGKARTTALDAIERRLYEALKAEEDGQADE